MTYLDKIAANQIAIRPSRALLAIYTAPFIAFGWLGGFVVKLFALAWASMVFGFQAGR